MIAIQLVRKFFLISMKFERLRDLHSIGVIHNDIKLENLLIGRDQESRGVLHMIDFGLSQPYLK